jgi:hypothetical protein
MNSLENVRRHLNVSETEDTITLTVKVTVSKNNGFVNVNGTPMNAKGHPFHVTSAVVGRNIAQHWEVFAMDYLSRMEAVANPISMQYGGSVVAAE